MAGKEKLFEGEHADMHLGTEEIVHEAVVEEAKSAAAPDAVMDSTAYAYDDDDEYPEYNYEEDAEEARIVAFVFGLVISIVACIVAIIVGRKIASKE